MAANETQVGGGHYKKQGIQHWDYVAANGLDYFQGQVTKYVSRWKDKNGLQDLEKAAHFLAKYIELVKAGTVEQHPGEAARKAAQEAQNVALRLPCGCLGDCLGHAQPPPESAKAPFTAVATLSVIPLGTGRHCGGTDCGHASHECNCDCEGCRHP